VIKTLVKLCCYHINILTNFSKNNENLVCLLTFFAVELLVVTTLH
jgi:hypothetical protein